jgi:hypothetical protein
MPKQGGTCQHDEPTLKLALMLAAKVRAEYPALAKSETK